MATIRALERRAFTKIRAIVVNMGVIPSSPSSPSGRVWEPAAPDEPLSQRKTSADPTIHDQRGTRRIQPRHCPYPRNLLACPKARLMGIGRAGLLWALQPASITQPLGSLESLPISTTCRLTFSPVDCYGYQPSSVPPGERECSRAGKHVAYRGLRQSLPCPHPLRSICTAKLCAIIHASGPCLSKDVTLPS